MTGIHKMDGDDSVETKAAITCSREGAIVVEKVALAIMVMAVNVEYCIRVLKCQLSCHSAMDLSACAYYKFNFLSSITLENFQGVILDLIDYNFFRIKCKAT